MGFGEILLILVAALVIFGPSKLPELGKSLGQGIREFKKATQALTEEVTKVAVEETTTHTSAVPAPAAQPAAQTPEPPKS
ncbi:MAG TPA: twin-arginine translocase TatA/TatE family subunit [Symbiobacteriaceae bacterium]